MIQTHDTIVVHPALTWRRRYDEVTDRTLGAREALARAEERRVAAEGQLATLRQENAALTSQLRQKAHEARRPACGAVAADCGLCGAYLEALARSGCDRCDALGRNDAVVR